MKEHLFDKRVVKRALQEGLVSKDDYQRMLDALPDLSNSLQSNTNDIDYDTGEDIDDIDDIEGADEDDDDLDDEEDTAAPEPQLGGATVGGATVQEAPAHDESRAPEEASEQTEHAHRPWPSEL